MVSERRERSGSRERRGRSGSREKKREKKRERSGSREGGRRSRSRERKRSRSREGRRRPSVDRKLERSESRERRRREGTPPGRRGEEGGGRRGEEGGGGGGRGGGGGGGGRGDQKCFECSEVGHIARDCPQKGGGRGGGGECYKCHQPGHFARECPGEGGGGGGGGGAMKESERYGLQKGKEPPAGVLTGANAGEAEVEKEGVNMGLSGALTEDTNTFNGVVIKYSEPPEARIPKRRWRFYVFKGSETLPTLHLHRQSAYLMGRDRKVSDLPIDHPSASKQHAVFQYRLVTRKKEDGGDSNKCTITLTVIVTMPSLITSITSMCTAHCAG